MPVSTCRPFQSTSLGRPTLTDSTRSSGDGCMVLLLPSLGSIQVNVPHPNTWQAFPRWHQRQKPGGAAPIYISKIALTGILEGIPGNNRFVKRKMDLHNEVGGHQMQARASGAEKGGSLMT